MELNVFWRAATRIITSTKGEGLKLNGILEASQRHNSIGRCGFEKCLEAKTANLLRKRFCGRGRFPNQCQGPTMADGNCLGDWRRIVAPNNQEVS